MDKKLTKSAIQTMIKDATEATEPIITVNHRIYPKEIMINALEKKLKELEIDIKNEGDN